MNSSVRPVAVQAALQAHRWIDFALNLLYPPRCGGCGVAGQGWLCELCLRQIRRWPASQQTITRLVPAPWDHTELAITCAAVYTPPLREAIHAFKYEGSPALSQPLARFLADVWQQQCIQADVIVPVPLHPKRQRERGYNQSEHLARHLSTLIGVPVDPRALKRSRHTEQQASLGAAERVRNVQGAFAALPERSNGKLIVLLDDVCTTGATLCECASALLRAGAASVCALTLARPD